MALKLYACANFPPLAMAPPCSYKVTDEQDSVINTAADHLAHEHSMEDTPQLRQDISNSLVDPPPGD